MVSSPLVVLGVSCPVFVMSVLYLSAHRGQVVHLHFSDFWPDWFRRAASTCLSSATVSIIRLVEASPTPSRLAISVRVRFGVPVNSAASAAEYRGSGQPVGIDSRFMIVLSAYGGHLSVGLHDLRGFLKKAAEYLRPARIFEKTPDQPRFAIHTSGISVPLLRYRLTSECKSPFEHVGIALGEIWRVSRRIWLIVFLNRFRPRLNTLASLFPRHIA